MITSLDSKTALVLVDLQKGIVGYPALAAAIGGVLNNANRLVAAFRTAGQPVVFINVDPGDARWPKTRRDSGPNNPGPIPAEMLQIAEEAGIQTGDTVITKHSWGAFWQTELHSHLQQLGVTGIVLGGIATSIGVEGTARQAYELGYNITFVTDVMTDMVPLAHEHSTKIIFPRMGEVGVTADVLTKLKT